MSTATLTALTSLVVGLATLLTAVVAVIKAVEAKNVASTAAVIAQSNHAETKTQIDTVKGQTDGILSALAPSVAENTRAVIGMEQAVKAMTPPPPPAAPTILPLTIVNPGGNP